MTEGRHNVVVPPPQSALVLANAGAGSAGDEETDRALAVLREHAEVELVTVAGPEDVRRAVQDAAGRRVVVLGGDGSVHGCLQALADQDLLGQVGAIGVVPRGTGNDFARANGIPFEPAEAARVALHGQLRRQDLLVDDSGGVVVNAVHAGVGAEATAHAEDVKGALGVAGYAVGAARAGIATSGWHLRVTVDGQQVVDGARRVLMVTITVGGGSVGGGTRVVPDATPGDGRAGVVISSATGPLARVGYALDLRRGRHTRRSDVRAMAGREVTVEAVGKGDEFRVNTDGDVGLACLARTWTVRPGAWVCRVLSAG